MGLFGRWDVRNSGHHCRCCQRPPVCSPKSQTPSVLLHAPIHRGKDDPALNNLITEVLHRSYVDQSTRKRPWPQSRSSPSVPGLLAKRHGEEPATLLPAIPIVNSAIVRQGLFLITGCSNNEVLPSSQCKKMLKCCSACARVCTSVCTWVCFQH